MTDNHPITPPKDLITKWIEDEETPLWKQFQEAARWGADTELEACCEWLKAKEWIHPEFSDELRAARRPKPLSLKERALKTVQRISKDGFPCNYQDDADWDTIRRALEQLDD